MLLSAVHEEEGEEKLNLLMVDPHIPAGSEVWSNAEDCKSAPSGFGGSNPPLPTKLV